ncbi:MAG TPA: OsmC family peroxiredoxin [Trueperaceae bacterium]|nr:OsmC family peroxiredoxin [Trueperaceae bacterium]
MSIADRTTQTTWLGSLAKGSGKLSKSSSAALDGLGLTWASRTEAPGGKTSPEELLAAAHSSCFSMALSLKLGEHKLEAERLEVTATVSLSEVNGLPTIDRSSLTVRGKVPGASAQQFASIVDEAGKLCPVSRLFAGAKISVEATLES